MSNFINIEDYDARIHREILDALVRDDEAIIEVIEDQSITLMRSYLNNRYPDFKTHLANTTKEDSARSLYAQTKEVFSWLQTLKP